MRTIVLNQTNVVDDGQNNKLVYRFPNSVQFKNHYLAVQSVTMFYSWYNISSTFGNNTFSYQYPSAGVITTFTVVIPDGIYNIPALNAYFQFVSVQNGTYMTTVAGQYVYFAEFAVNANLYAIELTCYTIPSAGVNPNAYIASALGFATAPTTLVMTIPTALCDIIGFPRPAETGNGLAWVSNNWYGTGTSSGTWKGAPYLYNSTTKIASYTSYRSPQVNQNASIYIACNIINNPYSIPSSIIYAITPSAGIGGIIKDQTPEFAFNKLIDGTYNELVISILGTNGSLLAIEDPNITILLVIKDGKD